MTQCVWVSTKSGLRNWLGRSRGGLPRDVETHCSGHMRAPAVPEAPKGKAVQGFPGQGRASEIPDGPSSGEVGQRILSSLPFQKRCSTTAFKGMGT